MAAQLVGVAQQIEALAKRRDPAALTAKPQVTLLTIRDQQVNFQVVDGRVHHQNMEFQVGDVMLRSQGSVGLDETVQLTLQIPIQDAWIAKEPLLAGLKGQSLQVPVGGTLTRPQMDQRAIASLSQQLLQGAAQQAVGGELNKALDKFSSRGDDPTHWSRCHDSSRSILRCMCGCDRRDLRLRAADAQVVVQQNPSDVVVMNATNVFAQAMVMPQNEIPRSLLAEAQAIAIVPSMVRGAFVFGVQHGRGVLVIRDATARGSRRDSFKSPAAASATRSACRRPTSCWCSARRKAWPTCCAAR